MEFDFFKAYHGMPLVTTDDILAAKQSSNRQPGESNSLDMSRILLLGDARRGFRKESGNLVRFGFLDLGRIWQGPLDRGRINY